MAIVSPHRYPWCCWINVALLPLCFYGRKKDIIYIHFRRNSAQGYRSKSDIGSIGITFIYGMLDSSTPNEKFVYPHPLFTTRPTTATAYRPPRGTQLAIYSTSSNRYLDVCVVNGAVGRFDDGETHFGV